MENSSLTMPSTHWVYIFLSLSLSLWNWNSHTTYMELKFTLFLGVLEEARFFGIEHLAVQLETLIKVFIVFKTMC